MTEKDIQKALWEYWDGHKYKFLNAYFFKHGWGESDFVTFLQTGNCYEVEVKVSRGDFRADFKKRKHKFMPKLLENTNNFCTFSQYYHKRLKSRSDAIYDEMVVQNKNGTFKEKRSSYLEYHLDMDFHSPNKFFFAVPEGLVSVDEVPDYAGLIYIFARNYNKVQIIKQPKFLHKNKIDVRQKGFNKAYYTYEREVLKTLK